MTEKNDGILQEMLEALNRQHTPDQHTPDQRKLAELLAEPEFQSLLALERVQSLIHVKYITDLMPGGFFIYHATGNEELLYANLAVVRLFGCETLEEFKELTGNTFPGMLHPDDREAVEASIVEQIAESQYDLDYVEYRIVQKDGTVRWIEDYGHFIDTEEGGMFYVFIADATEKREKLIEEKANALAATNKELLRRLNIIEGFSIDYESILYVDLDADEVQPYLLSTRTGKLRSLTDDPRGFRAVCEEYLDMWVLEEDREIFSHAVDVDNIRARLSTLKAQAYHTTYRVSENGEVVYLELRVANVSGKGPVSKIVLGFRRVDDEILQEMERKEVLEAALESARTAIAAKNAFLSHMSHDIQTPMNAVVGYTELAKRSRNDPEKLGEYLDKLEESGNRLVRMIRDVLLVSQMEGDPDAVHRTLCDLREIFRTIQKRIAPGAEGKNIDFSADLSHVSHFMVHVDSQKLEQVLLRLASNAVKYTPEGGSVEISVEEHGAPTRDFASYSFRVKDTGIGIEKEYLAHIYEAFERRKNTTESGMLGMGLGLTIAKSMVEMMGGAMTVESQVDHGSVFTVVLPLEIDNPNKTDHAPAEQDKGGKKRILVVEDNELNRELCGELLQGAGFLVDTAENGQIAVEKVRESRHGEYSLVLMDIQMPVMDGNAATRAIRALPDPELAGIPIVALSANALEEDRKRSMESGMNAHMAKPIQIGELVELLKSFIGE